MINHSSNRGKKKDAPLDIRLVRSVLIRRGDTLNEWARRKGYGPYAYLVVYGLRKGPKAERILEELRRDLGI